MKYLTMTTDRKGIARVAKCGEQISGIRADRSSGQLERAVPIGTRVEYLAHVLGGMVRVRFGDGVEAVMHPHCFAWLR